MSQMNHAVTSGPEPARAKTWFARNRPLAIGLGCSSLLVMLGVFVAGVMIAASVALRSSDAYQLALNRAEHHPAVIAELGSPVSPGWLLTGQVRVLGADGEASLAIPISGPRGSGQVRVRAHKSDGAWSFSQLEVNIPGRPVPIDLLATP